MDKPITYDYKTIKVKRELEAMATDAYEALGWEITGQNISIANLTHVNISMKRDRKINNKKELIKLQDKIIAILTNIETLQTKKKTAGLGAGITVGTIGCLTFGGGLSMCLLHTGIPMLIGGIALGVVGAGIGLLGWLIRNKIYKSKSNKIEPMLTSEMDKLSDMCEQAAQLID